MFDGLVSLVLLGVWIFGVVDVLTTDAAAVRRLPKVAWVVIVVLLGPIGVGAWWLIGRPGTARLSGVAGGARWPRGQARADGPTVDDPRQIMANIEARDRMLAEWAEEERRRAATGGSAAGEATQTLDDAGEDR